MYKHGEKWMVIKDDEVYKSSPVTYLHNVAYISHKYSHEIDILTKKYILSERQTTQPLTPPPNVVSPIKIGVVEVCPLNVYPILFSPSRITVRL